MKRRYMEVGDLVKIKYDGVVALITEVRSDNNVYVSPTRWYSLLGQPVSFRASQIELVNASR